MNRDDGADAAPKEALSYEQARDKLAAVVKRLEAGGLTLEQSLELWERGERLAAVCEEWLDGARARLAAAMAQRDDAGRDDAGRDTLGGMTRRALPRTARASDPRLRVFPLGRRIAGNGKAGAMNPVERAIRRVDATQRRFTPTAFVFGVIKKYGDDNGGVLVSNLAYSAFVSLFPLLLMLVTILGLIAAADPSFRESAVKNAVADQIPLLGQTLTSNVEHAAALEHHRADRGPARADLRRHRPGPGRAVHDGAGVEPARAGQARIRPAARAGRCCSCACSAAA